MSSAETPPTADHRRRGALADPTLLASLAVIGICCVVATAAFGTVVTSSSLAGHYLVQATAGALAAGAAILISSRFRLLLGETVAAAVVALMVAGPVAARGLGFFRGAVFGWADLLTSTPPVDLTPELRALPFVAAALGMIAGGSLLRLARAPGLAILGPVLTMALTSLFTRQSQSGALVVGIALLVGVLLLSRFGSSHATEGHQESEERIGASPRQRGLRSLGFAAAVLVAVAVTASLLAGATSIAEADDRFDLRDVQTPPWDPLALASPLAEVKAGLKTADAEPVSLFVVSGSTKIDRWRTASMPVFTGEFWSVADRSGTSDFVPVDTRMPPIDVSTSTTPARERFTVDVTGDLGSWLPTGGVPTEVEFDTATDIRLNPETGTLGLPQMLTPGMRYNLEVAPWPELDDAEFVDVIFEADIANTELALLPPSVNNLAADVTTGLGRLRGQRVIAIRDALRQGSYDLDVPPGHTFGHIGGFLQAVDLSGESQARNTRSLVGYEELYAATAAILVRESEIPARVAVGYHIPEERWVNGSAEVFASDINAWLEVRVGEVGWVPVDVAPDRSRQREDADPGTETQGVPLADPPKEPPPPDEEAAPEITDPTPVPTPAPEDPVEDETAGTGIAVGTIAAVSLLAPVLALLMAAFGIWGYKVWRRRKRRTSADPQERIVGAWNELGDRIEEAGSVTPPRSTPAEAARYWATIPGLQTKEFSIEAARLADQVSEAAFHPVPPTNAEAEQAWESYGALADSVAAAAGRAERVRRGVDPRPLLEERRQKAR